MFQVHIIHNSSKTSLIPVILPVYNCPYLIFLKIVYPYSCILRYLFFKQYSLVTPEPVISRLVYLDGDYLYHIDYIHVWCLQVLVFYISLWCILYSGWTRGVGSLTSVRIRCLLPVKSLTLALLHTLGENYIKE